MFAASLLPGHAASPELDLARKLNQAFVEVADAVSPSVVVIQVQPKDSAESDDASPHDGILELLPEEMRKEFRERLQERRENGPRPRRRPQAENNFSEQGSGVILRPDGYIITNGHVVENAEKVEVRLKDGRKFAAEVKGVDSESDIAVIKVEGKDLPAAHLGDSSKVRVGEFAIAIGAPFFFDYSVTFGHVSGKGRRLLSDSVMFDQDFLQTDASINPGNSGGPLLNIEGEVIGINAMIRGLNTGIGFAVPINLAREVADQLIDKGHFTRAWLGVSIESVGERSDATPSDLPVKEGVIVRQIMREGPSWGSELETQDVIVSVDGQPVRDVVELKRQISRKKVGTSIHLEVYRGDKKMQVSVTPGALPENRLASFHRRSTPAEPDKSEALGMTVRELDAEAAQRVGLERGEGVLVSSVEENSPAAERRIQSGDVITKINRRPVRSPKEFGALVRDADLKKGVSVTIVGEGGRRFEVLKQSAN